MNVWGLGDSPKRREIFTWLRDKQMNIYLIQETKCTADKEELWRNEWGFECVFNSFDRAAHGVLILFNNNFQYNILDIIKDNLGRYIIVHLKIGEEHIVLANIYGPNSDDPIFFQNLFADLENFSQYSFILAGDYNICLSELDKQGGRPFNVTHRLSRNTLNENMEIFNLVDVWRSLNPDTKKFTWRQRNNNIACRLDFFLISLDLANIIQSTKISNGYKTDHSFISLAIAKNTVKRGPGFFKLNTSLLLDNMYVEKIKALIDNKTMEYRDENIEPDLLWETIKSDIRGETIKYSSSKKKQDQKREKEIEQELSLLEQRRYETNNQDIIEKIETLNTELQNIYEKRTQGIMTRAKIRWLKDGEKNSKYFIGLEKRNFQTKSITSLIDNNGNNILNFGDILKEQKRFYSDLYAEREVDLENENIILDFFIQNIDVPKVTNEQKDLCDGPITKEECIFAIKSMENFKSPGIDGLPVEFYKIFWNDVSDLLINSFNHSYTKGELSITQKQGIITLLPKKDRDTRLLKNWRPISLLNCDYKILTKCLAARLKQVLPHIIHPNQNGFLKNRYIGSNIRLLFDIIDHLEENNEPGMIFSIDFEKAFDTVSWEFLNKCLDYFNFGDSFKKWILLLQTNISSCILNSGWSSGFFRLNRGVRQGCPISPYLFLICSELLGIGIRHSTAISGIKINDLSHKLSQFADDTQILLDGTQESLDAAIKLLKNYENVSGMKINFDKSEIAKLGAAKNNFYINENDIKFADTYLKILGIKIPLNGGSEETISLNYDPLIKKINEILSKWSRRKLSLYGKTVIIKSLLLPQLIYQLTNLITPPTVYLQNIDNKIFEFLWDGKKHKISRKQLYATYEEGGLKIPNVYVFSKSLRLKWIKLLVDENYISDWKGLFMAKYKPISEFILKSNICSSDVRKLNISNKFWVETLQIWSGIHSRYDPEIHSYSKHPQCFLWLNSNIKIKGKSVFYNNWYSAGIRYIKDLIDENGNFYRYEQFKQKYNLDVNFLKFYGIINSVSQTVNLEGTVLDIDTTLRKLLTVKSSSQAFYHSILSDMNKYTKRNCLYRWEHVFNRQFEWQDIFANIYSYTNDPKLRNFQYKVIHNIFPNNKILYKMGIENSSLCPNCNESTDSLEHYLWYCSRIETFWTEVKDWINTNLNINIELTPELAMFGKTLSIDHNVNAIANFLILHARYFIHCCRWTNNQPLLHTWLNRIKYREEMERKIAFENKKMRKHEDKWKKIQTLFRND